MLSAAASLEAPKIQRLCFSFKARWWIWGLMMIMMPWAISSTIKSSNRIINDVTSRDEFHRQWQKGDRNWWSFEAEIKMKKIGRRWIKKSFDCFYLKARFISILLFLFCSTSLPLASTRWVRSTFSSHCPLFTKLKQVCLNMASLGLEAWALVLFDGNCTGLVFTKSLLGLVGKFEWLAQNKAWGS